MYRVILGDPGADSGNEEKPKRAEKYESKERREKPLGTMSYQTSSKRSPPFWLLIGARKLVFFLHQSEARTAATVRNWSGKTLSPGALLAVLYFSSYHIQLFRERLSEKVHATIPKGIVGGFEFTVLQRNLKKKLARKAIKRCLRVLTESNKSRFDSYSRQELCIDHNP